MPSAKKESINKQLFMALKSRGYRPIARSKGDKKIGIPDADLFVFNFVKNGKGFGPARVGIDEKNNIVLYTNERLESSPQSKSKNSHFDDSWNGFKEYLSRWSRSHGMNGFKLIDDSNLESDMQLRQDMEKHNRLNEGYYPLNKKASYNDSIPSVKILLQHNRQIEEGEQRYRNIEKIFVENVNGERFLLPTRRPGVAKVYARHIAEGGTPYDERGKHITSLVEEYTKMAGFVRATKNGQFNESTQRLVNEGVNHYTNLRETLTRMISQRGYNKYFDAYTPVLNEEIDDETSLNELFVQETLDPRIESVMPILKRLSKNITEMSEVNELAEWAESITEVEDETTKTLAEPAEEMLDEVGIGTLKFAQGQADQRAEKFEKEIEKLKLRHNIPLNDKEQELLKKYELAAKHYRNLASKAQFHPNKMDRIKTAQKMTAMLPAKLKNVAEAPGAETLAHNDDTEEKNLKAFGLAEGPADAPVHPDKDADDKRWDDVEEGVAEGEFFKSNFTFAKDSPLWKKTISGGTGTKEDPYTARFGEDLRVLAVLMRSLALQMAGLDPSDPSKFGPTSNKLYYKFNDKLYMGDGTNKIMLAPTQGVAEDLDANQKAAGQLGPTEKVGPKGAVGKLVGASESVENDELNRIKEMIGYK